MTCVRRSVAVSRAAYRIANQENLRVNPRQKALPLSFVGQMDHKVQVTAQHDRPAVTQTE